MVEIIADQKELLNLALGLRFDIDRLMRSIGSDPTNHDKEARSQFLHGILGFLAKATGLEEFNDYVLLYNKARQEPAASGLVGGLPPPTSARDGWGLYQLKAASRTSAPTIVRPTPHALATPSALSTIIPTLPTPQPQYCKARGIWIVVAPPTATSSLLSQQIYGGPLERIMRYDHKSGGFVFLIHFLDPNAAATFLAFANTSMGRPRFPGETAKFVVNWGEKKHDINVSLKVLKAARDPKHPARRVLVFRDYFGSVVSRDELQGRLEALDEKFKSRYCVDSFEICTEILEGLAVFNMIGAAMKVVELHKSGLLGPEFSYCDVYYGRDPCDRSIPATGKTAMARFGAKHYRANSAPVPNHKAGDSQILNPKFSKADHEGTKRAYISPASVVHTAETAGFAELLFQKDD